MYHGRSPPLLYPYHWGGRTMHINFDGPWMLIFYAAWVGLVLFVVSIILDVW